MNKLLVEIAWFVVASGSYAQDSVFVGSTIFWSTSNLLMRRCR